MLPSLPLFLRACAPSLTRPSETIQQWVAWLLVLFTIWACQFVHRHKPNAIRLEERRRRDNVLDMMKAVLAYYDGEMEKPESERKMPEASRVYELLWDETYECKMTAWGISADDDLYVRCQAMYRQVMRAEMSKAIDATRRSRVPGAIESADKEEMKLLSEHLSGEKLNELLKCDKKVGKQLGLSFAVESALRKEAAELLRQVFLDQSKNARVLLKLVRPVLPHVVASTLIGMLHTGLRSVFHQIGPWVMTIEAGINGDMDTALSMLFNLWLGHMIIKALELPEFCYERRSKAAFGNIIRNNVMRSMVQQDYEYFDRTSAGVLQDRLYRDADELGENLISFPKHMLERLLWVGSNLIQVYLMTPRAFFAVACAPVALMCTFQYFTFQYFRSCNERARRIEEEGVSATTETLRQIKTVRQFAAEQSAATTYARRNLARQLIGERVTTLKRALEMFVWLIFDSNICLTIIVGLPYVHSGVLSAGALIDCFCKLNFNVNFCMREILEQLPRMARLLEPLGRICDLLQAQPSIEPPAQPAHVDVADATELATLLATCRVEVDAKSVTRLTLERLDGLKLPSSSADVTTSTCTAKTSDGALSAAPTVGAHLLFLSTADHRHVTPAELAASPDGALTTPTAPSAQAAAATARVPSDLTYPVRAVFSTKLRPARFRGHIEFRDVAFAYPTDLRKPVLRGLSFTVEPGQKVALVGPTGCGKSSCMSLVQRLYDPSGGGIYLDHRPLAEYDVHHLRSRVVIVDQHTVLFSMSIRDNITYGMDRQVSEAEVIQACVRAKAWDFIDEKPDKLMTIIKEGANLSGGQKQRLAIARAILRQPDVILLDEATSALDNANEVLVQKALDELAREGSALVIAHRLSTIKDADQIVVVDHGRAVEIGTHEELLDRAVLPTSRAVNAQQQRQQQKPSLLDECMLSKQPTLEDVTTLPSTLRKAATIGRCSRACDWLETVPGCARASRASSPTPVVVRRQRSSPSDSLVTGDAKAGITYRQLWDAATGDGDKKSLSSIGTRIVEIETELESLKAKQEHMLQAKRSLLGETTA